MPCLETEKRLWVLNSHSVETAKDLGLLKLDLMYFSSRHGHEPVGTPVDRGELNSKRSLSVYMFEHWYFWGKEMEFLGGRTWGKNVIGSGL